MKKSYIYLLIALIVLLIGYSIYYLLNNKKEIKETKKVDIPEDEVVSIYSDDGDSYSISSLEDDAFYDIDNNVVGFELKKAEENSLNRNFEVSVNGNVINDIEVTSVNDQDIEISKLGNYLIFYKLNGMSMGTNTIYIVNEKGVLVKSIEELENVPGMKVAYYKIDGDKLVINASRMISGPIINYNGQHSICGQTIDLIDKNTAVEAIYTYEYNDGIDFNKVSKNVITTVSDYLDSKKTFCD